MPRYKITIEYDGRPFVGWQKQKNGLAVQQAVELAIARFAGETTTMQAAGRTDAGVHARGQVAHFDLSRNWRADKLREALNAHLKSFPIAIIEAQEVAQSFEARFSALRRHYLYKILNRRAPACLDRGRMWHVRRPLDARAMHEAAQTLLGRHDFTTFRAAECQANSPMRTLERFEARRYGDVIEIYASAQSFLHHQVRSMVGSLEHVGCGKWRPEDLRAALEARDRARCGQVAPACGLYFMSVDYPEISQQAEHNDSDP